MAMNAGSVTIDDDGVEHRNLDDMATALYDALKLIHSDGGHTIAPGSDGVKVKRQMATVANRLGAAVVGYMKGHAEVVIRPGDGGLQKTANNASPSPYAIKHTPTVGPDANRDLRLE